MKPIVVIPARLAASRLPQKPLADIGGSPMILRVLRQALKSKVGPVIVAAGDEAIADCVRAGGGLAVLTDPDLPSGSDRVQAAVRAFDPEGRFDVVINLQGDIPFFDPAMLQVAADLLERRPSCDIATAVVKERSLRDRVNPDVPKAVLALSADGRDGRALYFTRSVLYGEAPILWHVGLYAYRREALDRFTAAPPSPLERREKLEQLRALEMGLSLWAAVLDAAPVEVNTPEDLSAARALVESDHAR
jgi:3-deoxy-manno-octulosonate cytidylyltransferase (CMP-KDO synthetase)